MGIVLIAMGGFISGAVVYILWELSRAAREDRYWTMLGYVVLLLLAACLLAYIVATLTVLQGCLFYSAECSA
jgi:hypothetical protein